MPVPLLAHGGRDVVLINGEARRVHYQFAIPHDQLADDPLWLWLVDKLAPADLAILKTPVHLVTWLQTGSLGYVCGQSSLPLLTNSGCAHSATFARFLPHFKALWRDNRIEPAKLAGG